jgi:hypothetical protein
MTSKVKLGGSKCHDFATQDFASGHRKRILEVKRLGAHVADPLYGEAKIGIELRPKMFCEGAKASETRPPNTTRVVLRKTMWLRRKRGSFTGVREL